MKISDDTTRATFLTASPSLLAKKRKSTKPFKLNRRLNNRMTSLWKSSAPMAIPISNYQIIPVSSLWTNTQLTPFNPTSMNTSPPVIASLLTNQQQQNPSLFPLSKSFATPRVTTTLIPLNICPTEYCQTVESTPLVNVIENRSEQSTLKNKSQANVTTHLIGDWIIRESSEPFRRKEDERFTPIKQLPVQEERIISNEPIASNSPLSPNVNGWTTDDVCSFFERVLEKNCYTSIIEEHLIDGGALLLLEDEHLISIFKMPLGPRLKLLNRINKLKQDDFSGL